MKHLELMKIYKMTEKELKTYVADQLLKTFPKITIGDGFVFAKGNIPVLLVAHLDTIHKETPKIFQYKENGNIISSPQGIGGDDRNGVYSVLEIARKYNCSVLFCEQEEVGGIGAEKFTKSKTAKELKFNYMIELDRMGSNDAVFYNCDNFEFEEFITKEFYKTSYGSFSDISILAPHFGCAAVNLSCGYYKAHTKDEYVVLTEIQDNIDAVCNILDRTTENDKFEYIEADYSYYKDPYGYNGDATFIISYYNANGMINTYESYAYNEYEAVGDFCVNNPSMSFNDILDIETL